MTVYLDASVLVSMFLADPNSQRALRLAERRPTITFSLWTIAEFSSALGVRSRMGLLDPDERRSLEAMLDQWLASSGAPVAPLAEDFQTARHLLRQSRSNLRAPDALHLAVCARIGADLASFDQKMLQAAAEVELSIAEA